jgi:hypothetical protein
MLCPQYPPYLKHIFLWFMGKAAFCLQRTCLIFLNVLSLILPADMIGSLGRTNVTILAKSLPPTICTRVLVRWVHQNVRYVLFAKVGINLMSLQRILVKYIT